MRVSKAYIWISGISLLYFIRLFPSIRTMVSMNASILWSMHIFKWTNNVVLKKFPPMMIKVNVSFSCICSNHVPVFISIYCDARTQMRCFYQELAICKEYTISMSFKQQNDFLSLRYKAKSHHTHIIYTSYQQR